MGNYPYPICKLFHVICAKSFLVFLYDQEEVGVKKKRLKERGQYPAIWDQRRLTTNDSLYAQRDYTFLRGQRDQSKHRIRFNVLLANSAIYLLN